MMSLGEPAIATFLAVFVRAAAWAYSAPVIGDQSVPARIRGGAAALIAFAVFPMRPEMSFAALAHVLPVEAAIGLLLGFASRLALAGAEAGGALIGIQLGLGFAGTYDANLRDESTSIQRIVHYLAAIAFLTAGGFDAAIRAMALPVVAAQLDDTLVLLISRTPDVLVYALRIAAPMILASFVANVAVALGSRAVPGLNVFSVMLACFLLLGGAVLILTSSELAREVQAAGGLARDLMLRAVSP